MKTNLLSTEYYTNINRKVSFTKIVQLVGESLENSKHTQIYL